MTEVRGKKVYIGLSGGVDSAVSAALLMRAGANVTGVFIKGWYPPGMPCTWNEDRRDAMRVAARLGIPFVTLDASRDYKQYVINYLFQEYRAGRTPNPDVMCNREIKFGVFYRFALAHGADYIATGHYRSGTKDQSYFLWAVPREILNKTIFPVSGIEKEKVRRIAKRFNLPVAQKKDSQGVCFLGSVSVKEFLAREFGDNPAILRTIGERVEGGYVASKNVARGTVVVTTDRASTRLGTVRFDFPNWIKDPSAATSAQLRYRSANIPGTVVDNEFKPSESTAEAPVPGQSIVFYDTNGSLVGGGIIE